MIFYKYVIVVEYFYYNSQPSARFTFPNYYRAFNKKREREIYNT